MSKAPVSHSSEYITSASVKSLASSMKLWLYSINEDYRKHVSYKYRKLEIEEYAVLRTETQGSHIEMPGAWATGCHERNQHIRTKPISPVPKIVSNALN